MNKRNTIIMIILFFIGLLTLFYPTLSNYYNEKIGSKTIYNYENIIDSYDFNKFKEIKDNAIKYNKDLSKLSDPLIDYKEIKNYKNILNVNDEGMMGYLSIDKIRVEIPIYHGTSNDTLNSFVGHVEGTSLPIGGNSTHSVLSAHRGLPSAKLFSDLDKLEVGDTFKIIVLDEVLTYKVDKISIVKPNNSKELMNVKDKDYLTLITCTPYGINTHRLLVRGIRVDNNVNKFYISTEGFKINKLIVIPILTLPIIILLILIIVIKPVKKSNNMIFKKCLYPNKKDYFRG